jgi:uncharacterized protein (TIGR03086 family)
MDATTMAAACESTRRFVEHVRNDQLSLPTPCDEWDVRSLLSHLVGTLALGEALLSDSMPSVPVEPGGLPAGDVLGGDPIKAYRAGMEALLAAATDEALGRMHTTPMGEMPGAMLGGFTTLDIAVHGWDLAVATGQDPTLDDDLAATVLGFARQTLSADTRAPRIGPEVPVDSTSVTDQLAGFLGRTP